MIEQKNNYPWDGNLLFNVNPKSPIVFTLRLRIPGWAQNIAMPSDLYSFQSPVDKKAEIRINGQPIPYEIERGYAVLSRKWKKGDVVELNLPMEVRRVVANVKLKDDLGKVALQRGPLIYCAEWTDNNGKVSNLIVPQTASFTTEYKPSLLNGVTVLKSQVPALEVIEEERVSTINQPFVAIPYYAWAHRGKGEMMIWFPTKVKYVDIIPSLLSESLHGDK